MSKIVLINTVCNGSTGKIMGDIAREHIKNGGEAICFYGRRKGYKDIPCKKFGNFFSFWFHVIIATIFDNQGHCSYFYTKKMIKEIKKEDPKVIHLHNIHGYYLNYPLLFKYLKKDFKGKIYWTLHDCWSFTGHCPHFILANCDKWKTQCFKCPNKKYYPVSLFKDNSYKNYKEKKELFTGLKDLTLIVPSKWLKELVEKSFLKEYKVIVKNNKINETIFKPTIDKELFKKYNIPKDKKILLGVASVWDEKKGLRDFIQFSKRISSNFVIVLVGLNNQQIKSLKKYENIIGIKRTENQTELASFYTMAYYFINPTYEDNYPTVNLEAIACGTKVICYDTGGCKEQITKEYGYIIPVGNIEEVLKILAE